MYLRQLTLTKSSGELIRAVTFQKGLNLVLGKADKNRSSNSLGKTTLIRCINFCLAGKIEEFFVDNENKKVENKAVKDFFIQNQVNFELILSKEFDNLYIQQDLKISRKIAFDDKTQKIEILNYIDDKKYSLEEFKNILQLRLFLTNINKPSFRQLITKFVRRNDDEVSNILKYMGSFVSTVEYSTIRFFLFGFKNPEAIEKQQLLNIELRSLTKKYNSLKAIVPEGLQQKIDLLETEIEEKEKLRDSYKINEDYRIDENELNSIELTINHLNKQLTSLISDRDTLISRINKIQENKFCDNPQDIKYIYEEAKLLNIEIQKQFEETILFHNSMLKNEENYLQRRVSKLNKNIEDLTLERANYTKKYNAVLEKLSMQGALAEFTKLNENITKLSSNLSKDKALLTQLGILQSDIDKYKTEIEELSSALASAIDKFNKVNIHIFNTYFSKFSEKLHNEKWYMSFDKDGTGYKFDVKAFESNAGSGKKQSLVAAFDIAYMAFIQDPNIHLPYPRFATQDKIEIIDIDELNTLADLVLNANGQLITPIIEDKFKNFNQTDFSGKVILTLTPESRFFNF